MTKLAFALCILLILQISGIAQSAPPERDSQVWTDTSVAVTILKKNDKKTTKLALTFGGTLRFGNNVPRLIDERVSVGLDFRVNRYVVISPGYMYRVDQPTRTIREWESRMKIDVNLERSFARFSIKDRNRVEHRFRNFRSDSTRYRNKFQFSVPIIAKKKELLSVFVADEPFFEFQSKKWTRNEFSAGISKKFDKSLSADFFYLLQNNRGQSFKYVHAFGVSVKFKIDR